jgi:hypothetical protein
VLGGPRFTGGAGRARLLRIEHLDLRQGALHLFRRLWIQEADQGPHGLDADPPLLEIALVLLSDSPGRQVQDADHALEQQVLHSDLAQLLLEPLPHLLLRRLLTSRRAALRSLARFRIHAVDTPSGT